MPTTGFQGKRRREKEELDAAHKRTEKKRWPLALSIGLVLFVVFYVYWKAH